MKLYQIADALSTFEFQTDEATGEITNAQEWEALNAERGEKREALALWVKELTAEAAAIKAEEAALADRRKAKENKAARIKEYLAHDLAGEKFETARVAVGYRKTKAVEIDDEEAVITWLCDNGRADLITTKFSISKTNIKPLLTDGVEIPHARITERVSVQIV